MDPAGVLEHLHVQSGMQVFAAARDADEHGIFGSHKFPQQIVAGYFGRHIQHRLQGNPFRHQQVMQHREHQYRVEGTTGPL